MINVIRFIHALVIFVILLFTKLTFSKNSWFDRPHYLPRNSNSFQYETYNKKHALYLSGKFSARGDAFMNTQGIIMNLGNNATPLDNINNAFRTWIYTASPIFEAKIDDNIHLFFNPDFGQQQYRIFDASVDINYFRSLSIMTGLQSSIISGFENSSFNYLGFTTTMSPWREIAINVYGELGYHKPSAYNSSHTTGLESWILYELAITNGAPDAAFPGVIPFSVNSEGNLYQVFSFNTGNKAFEGRVFINPFIQEENHILQHLGLGFAGSAMTVVNQIGLPAYLSIGRNVIFQFESLEKYSIAQGTRNRIHPQMIWYHHQFSIMGDYIISAQHLANGFDTNLVQNPTIQQVNHARQILFLWNLTGENFSWSSYYEPHQNFRPFDKQALGAFQLGFRLSSLRLDPSVFQSSYVNDSGQTQYNYSDPRTSVQQAQAYGVVLNWLWNQNFRLSTEFSYTRFKGGCSTGALQSPINPGCLTAPNEYIAQPGSQVIDRPAEVVMLQQASVVF